MASDIAQQSGTRLKECFFRYFQHEVTGIVLKHSDSGIDMLMMPQALQEEMERLKDTAIAGGERQDAVDHCLAGIARLSKKTKDASAYVPVYDQRVYGEVSLV